MTIGEITIHLYQMVGYVALAQYKCMVTFYIYIYAYTYTQAIIYLIQYIGVDPCVHAQIKTFREKDCDLYFIYLFVFKDVSGIDKQSSVLQRSTQLVTEFRDRVLII